MENSGGVPMSRFSKYTFIVVAVLVASLPAFALTGYRYDAENTGYVADDALKPPLSLLWKHSTDLVKDPIIATPALGPDAVYFCVEQKVFALDRLTGDIKWQFDTGTKVFSSPVYHEGKLYFGGQDSNLWVLNAGTGQPEWRFRVGGPIDCPPLIVGNMLYVGSDDDSLHAIDLAREGQVWAFGTRDDIKAAPAFSRGNIYFASRDEHLYCLDAAGTLRWRAKLKNTNNFSAPVVEGDRGLVFVTSDQYLHCFDTASGQARWPPFSASDLIVGSPALAASDRKLYVGSKDGAVYCVSALDGRAVWKYPKGEGVGIEPILSSPSLLGNDTLLVRTGPKLVAALNRQTGDLLWEYRLATPPERPKAAGAQPGAGGAGGMPGMPGGEGGLMGGPGAMGAPGGAGMPGAGGGGGMAPGEPGGG
ncbi:MAG: hypothetical protein FJX75_24180, partial [Armatimonadetes bacterium]|nr:hypothetical protein [Armatimonadota bacterium]